MDAERLKRIEAAKAKARNLPPLSEKEDAELTAAALADTDNPPLTEKFWQNAKPMSDERLARYRGMRGPQKAPVKAATSIRLDQDVLEHFRKGGPGWQSRINQVLRKAAGLA